MNIKKFGVTAAGEETSLITLENKNGMKVIATDMGASLVSVIVPDKNGNPVDVITGYATSEDYENNRSAFGATIGRSGNRIGGASLTINGVEYKLAMTGPNQNLHSQPNVFYKRKWNFETEGESVTFFINSPEGDQGYPGSMDVEVCYNLTDDNELMISYYGVSDKDTIMNMTNHSYFNLNGHKSGDILNHTVQMFSDYITETDENLIPTGVLMPVDGTAFDFRTPKTVGQDINADEQAIKYGHGYDHNFVVNDGKVQESAELIAKCTGDKSGITMEVYTDLPGVQVFTANGSHDTGKEDAVYGPHCAICFETQYAPDAVHHENFASPIIKAYQETESLTVYRFLCE